jgi:predicted GNAT family acetyltransferase
MTLDHRTGTVSIERLGPSDLVEVFGFLDRDPILNVYLLALTLRDGLANPRDEYWGARREDELVGLLHLGTQSGATLPLGDDPATQQALADQLVVRLSYLPRRFQVIGPRAATRAIARRLSAEGLTPRLLRDQIYMHLERHELQPFERLPQLRRAAQEDLTLVHRSGAELRAEELEEDPRVSDPVGYTRRVEEECRDGYTYLWVDGEGLCFRASVSAQTPDAAQVSGVFTPPQRRNRGLARRGLSELCARLFEGSCSVCLFVNDFNAPAIAAYRRIGFRKSADWASAFYDAPRGVP